MSDHINLTKCLSNARVVVRDALTYVYVMSEHKADMDRHNLGQGAFASSIALLATLNLLAKVHYILTKGGAAIVGDEHLQAYNAVKEQIKNSAQVRWADVKPFMPKPRIGDVNESDAFVAFVMACPVDFGLPRDNPDEARRIWKTFRNKLTHLITLANDVESGQMLMGISIVPSRPGMYQENLQFIRRRIGTYKAFDIPAGETKAVFRDKKDISADMRQMMLNDKCHVERLAISVDMTIDWLIGSIGQGAYSQDNLGVLAQWLDRELTPAGSYA